MKGQVLALVAHPDDAEVGMGGTLARFAASGYNVHILIASVPDQSEIRLKEAAQGARLLGAELHILDGPKGTATWQVEDLPLYELVGKFDRYFAELHPQIIFTHWINDTHFDHVCVARAALSAARGRRVNLYFAEQANLYAPMSTAQSLDTFVDVSAFMDQRIASIYAHESQTAGKDLETHIRARSRAHGERFQCEYAEAFAAVLQHLDP